MVTSWTGWIPTSSQCYTMRFFTMVMRAMTTTGSSFPRHITTGWDIRQWGNCGWDRVRTFGDVLCPWASYQIRNIAGCACAGNAGNVFPCHRLQRKPLVSGPGMHHGTCVTHVPWCMSGSLASGGGEKRSRHSRRMRTRNFPYLVRGPLTRLNLQKLNYSVIAKVMVSIALYPVYVLCCSDSVESMGIPNRKLLL